MLRTSFRAVVTALSLVAIPSLATDTTPALLSCHDTGGGYLTQSASVTRQPDQAVRIELTRFSPVPEIVPNLGLTVEGQLVKRLTTVFPASLCRFRTAPETGFPLLLCATGIAKISAELEALDGSLKTVTLRDNFTVELLQQRTDTVSLFSTNTSIAVQLENAPAVGFLQRSCR